MNPSDKTKNEITYWMKTKKIRGDLIEGEIHLDRVDLNLRSGGLSLRTIHAFIQMAFRYFSDPATSFKLLAKSLAPYYIGARAWAGLGFEFKDSETLDDMRSSFKNWMRMYCGVDISSQINGIKYPQDIVNFSLKETPKCKIPNVDSRINVGELFLLAPKGPYVAWYGKFRPLYNYPHKKEPLGIRHFYQKYFEKLGIPNSKCE